MIPPITLVENLELTQKLQNGYLNSADVYVGKHALASRPMLIKRNPRDDTFNIEIPNQYWWDNSRNPRFDEAPYININNKLEFKGNSSIFNQIVQNGTQVIGTWKANHLALDDTKFRNLAMTSLGNDVSYSGSSNHPEFRRIMFYNFGEIVKNATTSFDNYVELKTISKLVLKHDFNKDVVYRSGNDWYTPKFEFINDTSIEYSHLFIKPTMPNRFTGSDEVAEIYGYRDDGEEFTEAEYAFQDMSLKSSSIGNDKLNVYFEKYTGQKQLMQSNEKPYLIGKMKISDPTYFDYSSNKTKIGFNTNSIIGEVIPYSFEGDYTRQIEFSANAAFKNMKFSFSTKLEQPVLNPSNGSVILKITDDNTPKNLEMFTFTPEDIKIVREKQLDLIGLKRLANE